MGADTTVGLSHKTHTALKKQNKNGETLEQTINRLIQQNNNGKKCPQCGSEMKVTHARPFQLFYFDLKCTNCDYTTQYEALKGVKK